MTLSPVRRRNKRRIANLPTAHDCGRFGIWVRRPKTGHLVCVVCGK